MVSLHNAAHLLGGLFRVQARCLPPQLNPPVGSCLTVLHGGASFDLSLLLLWAGFKLHTA